MSDLSTATEILERYVKRDHIPAVVHRPAPALGGRSLYQMACDGEHADLREVVRAMFDLRTIQP